MIDRKKLIERYPIADYIRKQGIELKPKGKELICLCPFHGDKSPSMHISQEKQTWFCFPCGTGGSVIDFAMKLKGLSIKDAMYQLAEDVGLEDEPKSVTEYKYCDRLGRQVMAVDRVQVGRNKDFIQYKIVDGKKVPGVKGVERVLYRCESWANKEEIEICEGEKCVHAFEKMGYDATCNAGGSGAWASGYAAYFKDKHVTVWPDNDEPGGKWCNAVIESLGEIPASIRICRVPAPYNDVADILEAKGDELAVEELLKITEHTPRINRGHDLPIYSAEELMRDYHRELNADSPIRLDLGCWIPRFRDWVKPCVPGDVVTLIAGTGMGKTALVQNIKQYATRLPCLFFELELSKYMMAERSTAVAYGITADDVEKTFKGREFDEAIKRLPTKRWSHIWTCPMSNINIEKMTNYINKAELKMGVRPAIVAIDYIQLVKGGSGSRYEKISNIAEDAKTLAKECNVIVILLSQISRKTYNDDGEIQEVTLTDAKDSGSIENSSSLVVGAWRTDPQTMILRVLKNSRGSCGEPIECLFDGARYTIKQKIHGVNDGKEI